MDIRTYTYTLHINARARAHTHNHAIHTHLYTSTHTKRKRERAREREGRHASRGHGEAMLVTAGGRCCCERMEKREMVEKRRPTMQEGDGDGEVMLDDDGGTVVDTRR